MVRSNLDSSAACLTESLPVQWQVEPGVVGDHYKCLGPGCSICTSQGPCLTSVLRLQVDGNMVTWEKWHIRTSFNYREGLVLHNVG